MEIKKTLESDAVNHSNSFCNPAHNGEHQQQAAAAGAATAVWQHTTQQRTGTFENMQVLGINGVEQAYRYSVVKPHTMSTST